MMTIAEVSLMVVRMSFSIGTPFCGCVRVVEAMKKRRDDTTENSGR
jgi:hypothetical protein